MVNQFKFKNGIEKLKYNQRKSDSLKKQYQWRFERSYPYGYDNTSTNTNPSLKK